MKKHKPQTPKQCTINSTSTRILLIVCSILLSASITNAQLPFGQNNVVVLQVGDGVSLLNGRSRPVSLIEYTPAGVLVNEHPVSHSGGNRLTISGNAASEGQITRSADLLKIVIAGYDADTGLQSVGSTSASSVVPRVIGVMDGSGNYSRPTNSSTFFSGNGFRSAASNCDDYWGAGAGTSSGINYFGLGTPGNVSSFIEDNLIVNIFNGQLYFSTQNTFTGIYAVGTGLPTGTGNPSNVEIDLPFGSSPYAFAFNANSDVCYIADGNTDGTGGVQRWYKFLGFWTYDYTLNVGTNVGARGLTVDFSSPNPVIFATTSTNPTKLIKITDTGSGSGFTVLATSTPNTAFRGVVFAPFESVAANPTSNSPICEGTTLQLFANATGAPALTYLWSGVGTFSSNTASNPTVTGATTGYYSVTVSDACGSVTDSVYVVVNSPSESHDTISVCNTYTWNGNTYTTSGDYTAGPFTNAAGCDSTAYLNLTIRYSSESHDTVDVCNSYIWNGNTYTTSGDYSAGPFTNAAGCDSTAYLNLTIRYSSQSNDTVNVCNTYTWNGNTYTSSGDYSAGPFTNVAGCDSTAYLNLIIRYNSESHDTVSVCNTYTWNGNTYATSGDYAAGPFTNTSGCDSSAFLNLTIRYNSQSYDTIDVCNSYTWNGNTYTTSGDYFAGPFTNAAGCDSTAYLNLTIRYSSQSNDTVNVCNTYTWNGNTYTSSGDYSAGPFTNAAGCDSTAYLNLIIRYNSESHDTVSVCNTYTWNGNTYTASGDYSAGPFANAAGCDSTANLNLTIRYSSASYDTLVACEMYEWNAIIYTVSGDYSAGSFTNAAGCDSIANLHLTVLHADDNNVCTIDACDPLTGVTNTPISYDDNDVCTIDACDPITGPSHTPINYDDNDVCTIDACDPITGPSHTLIDYDDNNVCTIDACDPITGISHSPVNIDDGNPCTVDACDSIHGVSHVDISGVFPVDSISGPLSQCVGSFNGVSIYSVPAIPGATSYSWSVPPGVVISNGQGTNSITVNWGFSLAAKGVYGPICVTVFTLCGYGQSCDFLDISMIAPVTPSSISGPSKLCPGDTAVYSVGIVARATSYNWTSTGNISIISGNGTNVITVVAGPGYTSGSLSVKTANACGSSPLRTKSLLLNSPSVPAAISGSAAGVCGMSNFIYSVAAVPNATGYFWTIPASATLNSGQGSNSISVSFPGNFTSGTITVSSSNNCGTSAVRSLSVVGAPAAPGIITGSNSVCTGSLMHYSVATVMNTTTYTWTAPGIIATGQGTKEIDVQYGSSPASSQIITVTASNACGTSGIRILNQITIAFCPRVSGTSSESISIYPNPNSGNFTLELESVSDNFATITITDLSGRIIHNEVVTLSVGKNIISQNADLSTGIYLVKISADTEEIVKLIVE